MSDLRSEFWTDKTSVLFTSYWGWTPATWGTLGFTGDRGLARRNNLLRELTDPFITVVYVTSNKTYAEPDLEGKIAGFYLVSHEVGDRDEFTHPAHYSLSPEKWRHSLRALRAFSYVPEFRLTVADLDRKMLSRARSISAMGQIITVPSYISRLRETPWIEVDVYSPTATEFNFLDMQLKHGFVKAGPFNKGGYFVSENMQQLNWELYVLRLVGNAAAYLGHSANGNSIYKIGLSLSPDSRRVACQNSMPRGAFLWTLYRTNKLAGFESYSSFEAVVAGEYAMKKHLAQHAEWLGGEFYLASEPRIEEAWQLGHAEAGVFRQ